jgi:hypothetical protein
MLRWFQAEVTAAWIQRARSSVREEDSFDCRMVFVFILGLATCSSTSSRTHYSRIDQLDSGVLERGHQLHERIDVGSDDAVTGFHALDRRH